MAEVKITYETLFDLLRRERGRNDLQALDATFYVDVVSYMKEKKQTLSDAESGSSYSVAEQEKIKIQLKNVKKIIQELYETREKKILNLAMHKARTGSRLIDTSNMLGEEKKLFEESCEILKKYKEEIVGNLTRGELPSQASIPEPVSENKKNEQVEDEVSDAKTEKQEDHTKDESSEKVKVKISATLPKFVGLDKEIYGPFNPGDESDLPPQIAELLIKKGRAERL